jgi:hypothetical protein
MNPNDNRDQTMEKAVQCIAIAGSLALFAAGAIADDDLKGTIDSVDPANGSFVVQGITIHTDDRTDYDDGLTGIGDLQPGMRVDVEYESRQGRNYAEEIELDN